MMFKNTNCQEELDESVSFKMYSLLSMLQLAVKSFESIADKTGNKNIKMAFLAIGMQFKQYANELDAQLKSLKLSATDHYSFYSEDELFFKNSTNDDVFIICERIEYDITEAYMGILQNYMSYYFLKQILRNQLEAISGAFHKMKLLNLILS